MQFFSIFILQWVLILWSHMNFAQIWRCGFCRKDDRSLLLWGPWNCHHNKECCLLLPLEMYCCVWFLSLKPELLSNLAIYPNGIRIWMPASIVLATRCHHSKCPYTTCLTVWVHDDRLRGRFAWTIQTYFQITLPRSSATTPLYQ